MTLNTKVKKIKHLQEKDNNMLDNIFLKKYEQVYGPKVQRFFDGLESLNVKTEEVEAIPGLFLPCCGSLYNESLVKMAFIGKETLGWNDDLYKNLQDYKNDSYDTLSSLNLYREQGPIEWRNNFWWYVIESLAIVYGSNASKVLNSEASESIINSFAWGNCYSIESWASDGVDRDNLQWTTMNKIQMLSKETELSNIDTFIDVFRPNVIFQLFRNNNDKESFKITEKATFVKSWGEEGFVDEYSYRGVIIIHCWHPSYLPKQSITREDLAKTFRDILCSHHEFKRLGNMPFYTDPMQCLSFGALANKHANENLSLTNQDLAREIITAIALELRKQDALMTARCLVSILNTVDRFKKDNWIYSLEGRGPCSVVRGVYNYLVEEDRQDLADLVALSFTKVDGEIAWE